MKTFRIILLIILGLLDTYFIYSTIGYIWDGLTYPKLVGDTTSFFCGMFIMGAIFFAAAIITTIIYIIVLRKLLKSEK